MGHLVRSYRIARALAAGGMQVTIVSGGVPTKGLDHGAADLVQLPPVKAGERGFSDLVHPDGTMFSNDDRAKRRDLLLQHFDRLNPDILLTEAFPFGRRQMRFELIPLLERAHRRAARPLIAASVRDILQDQKTPARAQEIATFVEQFYDAVLVHGTPEFIPLTATFPLATGFADKIRYTGLVGPDAAPPAQVPSYDVIVSAGGGAVGAPLIAAALGAHKSFAPEEQWLIVTGPHLPEALAAEIEAQAAPGLIVKRFVPDLPDLLCGARLSISQAGYNTVADILRAGRRAVLVPFAAGGETEQTLRAETMADRGLAVSLTERDLSAQTLREAILRARQLPQRAAGLPLQGAAQTHAILQAMT
ncbi:glycosyl transferase [Methylovirgula sp. 4M-Z18]|nr:glycosyl transferase [Methylovirgula sp. 4M-Z18]